MRSKQLLPPKPLFDTLEHLDSMASVQPNHAASDIIQVKAFLYAYRGSEATFSSYRRELERFLQWLALNKKSLTEIQSSDIEQYIEFCQKPPLSWIGKKQVARFINREGLRIPNPDWRPFVVTISKSATRQGQERDANHYQLSQKAIQAIFSILGSFFNFLIEESYLSQNPVARIRQKSKFIRKQQSRAPIRRLSELQWVFVIETIEQMAAKNSEHERSLFIVTALYAMYLRISELSETPRWQPKMGDFYSDNEGDWWFITVGKGNKERIITVSDAMLEALKRYRKSLGLSALPARSDNTPLLAKQRGAGGITSTRQIRSIVQYCFDQAIMRMLNEGWKEEAEQLAAATVHWLRHTGISDDVKHRPREHVRDDAGHSSSAITDRYIDVELRERHASGRKKQIKPEGN